MENRKLYTKHFILLIASVFLATTGFLQLMPVLPLFASNVIHLDDAQIGLIVGSFSISAILGRPIVGYFLDNYTKTKILLVALVLFSASIYSYTFITSPAILIIVRLMQGFSWATVSTSTATIAMDLIPPNKKGEGIAQYSLAMPTAMVIGPAMSVELLAKTNSYNLVFIVSFILCIAAIFCAYGIKNPYEVIIKRSLSIKPSKLYEMRVSGTAFIQFCYSFCYGAIVTYIPLHVEKALNSKTTYFFMTCAICIVSSRLFIRKTFDRKGPTMLLLLGFISNAFGAFTLSQSVSTYMLIISGALCGIGSGLILPAINSMAMNLVEPYNRGRANATIYTAIDIGMGLGALLMGIAAKYVSYRGVFIICSIIPVILVLFYFTVEKKRYYKNIIK